jgi:hypothetical protein
MRMQWSSGAIRQRTVRNSKRRARPPSGPESPRGALGSRAGSANRSVSTPLVGQTFLSALTAGRQECLPHQALA